MKKSQADFHRRAFGDASEKIRNLEDWAREDFDDRDKMRQAITAYYFSVKVLDQQLSRVTKGTVFAEVSGDLVLLEGMEGVFRKNDVFKILLRMPDEAGVDKLRKSLGSIDRIGASWETVLPTMQKYPFVRTAV